MRPIKATIAGGTKGPGTEVKRQRATDASHARPGLCAQHDSLRVSSELSQTSFVAVDVAVDVAAVVAVVVAVDGVDEAVEPQPSVSPETTMAARNAELFMREA